MTKQYLLLCDEEGKKRLEQVSGNTVQFLEVQGMAMEPNRVNVLVTPILPPVTPMTPPTPPTPEPEDKQDG